MIEHIPELIEADIDAFKIEGRMRDPIYIETATKCYREAIDAYFNKEYREEKVKYWLSQLNKVYNRGFSTGFYYGLPTGTEIQREDDGNVSKYRKSEIGKVLNYYPERKAAKILLSRGKLKLGDEIFITGTHTDTYLRQKVTSIQIKQKKNLTETPIIKSGTQSISIGVLVDKPVKKNDKVFKLTIKQRK